VTTSSPDTRATAASIVGIGVAIGVAYTTVELLPLESRDVGLVWISAVFALTGFGAGVVVGWRWPEARRQSNLLLLDIVLTGALWMLLFAFHGEDQSPSDWWARMVLAVFSFMFVAVWFTGADVSARFKYRRRVPPSP
jgi:hypothetical protein